MSAAQNIFKGTFFRWLVSAWIKKESLQQQAEEARVRLAAIVEFSDDAIIGKNSNGIITSWNHGAEKLFGYTADEMLGTSILRLVPADRQDEERRLLEKIRRGESVEHFETERQTKGGRLITVSVTVSPIKDTAGKIVGASKVVRDVTERKQAEAAIREREARYRTLVENIRQRLFIKDLNCRYVSVNNNFARDVGVSPEAMVGKTGYDFFPQDLADKYHAQDQRVLATGKTEEFEDRYIIGNQESWIHTIVTPVRDDSGEVIGICGIFDDITERKRVETELAQAHLNLEKSLKFTKALLSSIPTPVFYKDKEGRYLGCNRAFSEIMGVTSEEIQGKTVFELWPSEHARTYHEKDLALINNPVRQIYEYKVRDKNGVERPVIYVKDVFRDENDEAAGIVGAFMDIAPLKQAEVEIRQLYDKLEQKNRELENENQERMKAQQAAQSYLERLQIATRAARIGIWDWNIVDNVLIWDDTICDLYGVPHGFFKGGAEAWSEYIHPDDRSRVLVALQAGLRGECEYTAEFRIVWPDGSIHNIKSNSQAFFDESGKPLRMVGTNIDISAHKHAEDEIRQLNTELEQRVHDRTAKLEAANEELESFSYSVSHDLRAPLRAVDGFSQALMEDYASRLDETGKDYLNRIRASAGRMGQLIDDMLKLSHISRVTLRRQPVDLRELALSIVDELRASEPQRCVEVQVAESMTADADPNLMRIALENLLGNAWKFTAKTPKACIEFGQLPPPGPQAPSTFFVRDNGAGFDMAYAGKLFGVFQRLHRQDEFPGTGIGLVTVARIIHLHRGEIRAEGVVGQGATFLFTLSSNNNAISGKEPT